MKKDMEVQKLDIIIASSNQGKLREFKRILEPLGYNVLSKEDVGVIDDVEEVGTTFAENAKLKAKAISNLKHCEVLSDDSGIMVDFLNGEPGVYSARYLGLATDEEKRKAILEKLNGVPEEDRGAQFVCDICYIDKDGNSQIVEGIWRGKIAYEEAGTNGFGYDSIFIPEGDTRTSAQMSGEEKNAQSHRAIAIKKLLELLNK